MDVYLLSTYSHLLDSSVVIGMYKTYEGAIKTAKGTQLKWEEKSRGTEGKTL
jgi:hypothetical protein